MNIRLERTEDYTSILKLTHEAFLTLDYPGRQRMDEHFLIHLLKDSECVIRELCLVAESEGELLGHILYTKSVIKHPDGTETPTISFGPLSVLPKCQKQGVGSALVKESLKKAQELGYGAAIITGVPEYYPKLGFRRGREYNLTLEDGSSPDALMAYELRPGYLKGGVLHFLPPEFETAETDDEEYWAFHREFMREYYPHELTLRPLYESDVSLMEGWLYTEHVAKWYKYPEDWLNEINTRHGEFSFLNHFIAEYEGIPVGFCQYYDCYLSQEHEVWSEDWRIIDGPGSIFSIDYFIGDPLFLKRGFGKKMISLMLDKLRNLGAKTVIVQPEKENAQSNYALEANGFRRKGDDYVFNL